ncbi:hypothetical protein HK096_010832, partial [Nowakowskiella sp. JEL0078]
NAERMTRQVSIENTLSPLVRFDSTTSNSDGIDLDVKKRLQEFSNQSAKAYEFVWTRSRRQQNNTFRT